MKIQPFDSNIGNLFRSIIKGNNFITPNIYGYTQYKYGIIEISNGKFMDIELWGVTIIKNNVHDSNLSKSLNSLEEVQNYILELNREDYSQLKNLLKDLV